MKRNYTILLMAILFYGSLMAQETQKNFINYQGVARNGAGQLMANETMTIGIALKMGSSAGAAAYAENHSVGTDANGVFSLKIGSGEAVSGEYNTIIWGNEATFVTVLVNGSEIGTTEIMAVPYALSSGDGAQKANEVPYDNTLSGLTATDTQQAIDELVGSGVVDADADPTNELQDITLTGTDLSISEGSTIDLSAIVPPGGTDDQNAAEVPFDNTTSGLLATDAQAAIDELATSGMVDTDDQDLSLSGTTLQITDGTGVDLSAIVPPGGTDDQNAAEVPFDNTASGLAATDSQAAIDELATSGLVDTDDQDLSLSGTTLQITDGASVDLSPIIPAGGTDDQNAAEVPFDNTASGLVATDAQAAIDELASSGGVDTDDQALVLTGDVLTIQDGAGSVDLSVYGDDADADSNNEVDVTAQNGILLGDGTDVSGLLGTADGQVPKWDATSTSWLAGTDATGSGGSSPWSESGTDIYYTNGDVGIGTDAPNSPLEIVTDRVASISIESTNPNGDGWIRFNNNTGRVGYAGMFNGTRNIEFGTSTENPTGKVHLTTDASPRLTVVANGDVGIGTEEPEEKLHVAGNLFMQTDLGSLILGLPNNGNQWRMNTVGNGATLRFRSKQSGSSTLTTRFRMLQDGEFQMGVNGSPTAWAHIRNNSTLSKPQLKLEETDSDYARLELTNNVANGAFWHVAGLPANNSANARLNFYFRNTSGGADQMTVTGDGKVGINGTPQARLHIFQRGQGADNGLRFSDGTANLDWDVIHRSALWFVYGGNPRAGIDPSTGAYIQASDRRLKTNIANLSPILDRVNQLRPVTYHFKSDSSNKNILGLIAQEVQPLFPELVSSSGEDGMLALDYSAFSVVAIKAIQEQQRTIAEQGEKIANLEERLKTLEARFN